MRPCAPLTNLTHKVDTTPPVRNTSSPKIFLHNLTERLEDLFAKGFSFLEGVGVRNGDRIAIKPNLTFPVFRKGVMTNPETLEALVLYLKNFTDHIAICESDSGGYNPFSMNEVFDRTGIRDFAKRHGVQVINMTDSSSRSIRVRRDIRNLTVPLPEFLLDATDLFITMPVPKVHANAIISVSLKNQWGVIQQPKLRLKLHPYFKEVIYAVNKALPHTIAVVDGKYGLTRNGPMRGDVIDLDWLLMGNDIFITDYVVAELMGFDPYDIPYLRYALKREGIHGLAGVKFNTAYKEFEKESFYLKRAWTDYPGLLTFHSRLLAYIGYESILARPLHWLLYRFREPFY
jgi:uncharacterized protein (DUF362 family)